MVNSIMSGRNPPLYFTLTLIAMQGHQNRDKSHDEAAADAILLSFYYHRFAFFFFLLISFICVLFPSLNP